MRVIFTRAAHRDLAEIEAFIAHDNIAAARRFILRLLDACEALIEQPRAYAKTNVQHLRKRSFGDYLIFYRLTDDIEIVRILHSARDWVQLLDPPA